MRRCGHSRGRSRPAFTLLEVLLATAIGVILMGAMYAAMNMQLRHAQAGREAVEQTTLVRALMARIEKDINASLGVTNTSAAIQAANQAGAQGSTAQTATSSSSSTSTGSTAASSSSASSSSASGSSSTSGSTSGSVLVNVGVQGDSGRLILSLSRVPREFTLGPNSDTSTQNLVGVSDLRLVSYWLVGGGGSAQGLARQEYQPVTSQDALNVLPPDVPDPASCVIAEEVQSLTFSYFDGSAWQDSWDGTQTGPDGVTPIGPPVAIAIVLGLPVPGSGELKSYRHVVAIPAANYLQNASTNGSTTNTGNTGQ